MVIWDMAMLTCYGDMDMVIWDMVIYGYGDMDMVIWLW